jgi:hypothetical protein
MGARGARRAQQHKRTRHRHQLCGEAQLAVAAAHRKRRHVAVQALNLFLLPAGRARVGCAGVGAWRETRAKNKGN